MGDIADWVLEGGLCQSCGEYLGKGDGYPTLCPACADIPEDLGSPDKEPINPKVPCPTCQRRVKAGGLKDHMRDKHGVKP